MGVTEIARRSDSLYHDNIKRRELCDIIAYLEADLREARETIDVLRQRLRDAGLDDGGKR